MANRKRRPEDVVVHAVAIAKLNFGDIRTAFVYRGLEEITAAKQ